MTTQRGVFSFLAVTFALTWTAWLGPPLLGAPNNIVFGAGGLIFLLGVFMPGLVALAFTNREHGRAGVARLLGRIGRYEVSPYLYVFALGYMAAARLCAAGLHRIVSGEWPQFGETPVVVMVAAIALSTWVQAGEELGWRGYALPRLASRLGLRAASVVLGVIWAVWHLPLFYLATTDSFGQSFPVYLLHVTAISVMMAWLYWKSGESLLLVMMMHASINNTGGIVPGTVPAAAEPLSFAASTVAWATVVVSWMIAAVLIPAMPRRSDIVLTSDPNRP